jgi:translation initiation factor IF-3
VRDFLHAFGIRNGRLPNINDTGRRSVEEAPIRRPHYAPPPTKEGPRVNEEITARQVRVIDDDGENHGVITVEEGIRIAEAAGLDLVEVSPNADPPVCKILDYGKFKYEQQKRKNEARKKQKTIEVKEIKFRPNIEQHDYEVKMRSLKKFIEEGDKVKVTLRFRGREMAHQELGLEVLQRVQAEMEEAAKVEQRPNMEGRQMIMVLAPR